MLRVHRRINYAFSLMRLLLNENIWDFITQCITFILSRCVMKTLFMKYDAFMLWCMEYCIYA